MNLNKPQNQTRRASPLVGEAVQRTDEGYLRENAKFDYLPIAFTMVDYDAKSTSNPPY
jgi:hypothetical protein